MSDNEARVAKTNGKRTGKQPSFRNLLTFRLHRVARISERISEQYYRKHLDLSLPECRVIGITAGYGAVSFKRVASEANLEKSYASRVVSALVDRGIMEKLINPEDSRSVLLQLTEHGKQVHGQTYALALALNDLLQAPFADDHIDAFQSFLTGLEQQLDRAAISIEDGGMASAALVAAPEPPPESDMAMPGQSFALDRNFARQLHDMLGRYLAAS